MNHNDEKHLLDTVAAEGWRTVGIRQHHGLNVFLNALHSSTSLGIGEFLDLLPLIEWCHTIGMDIIQLLPLNDSCLDPSPYNAISSCALNPIYLKLSALPHLNEIPSLNEKLDPLYAYNSLPRIAYIDVLMAKMHWLRDYFHEIAPTLQNDQHFHHFQSANPWVETYALFRALLDKFNYSSWENWPEEYRKLTTDKRVELIKEYEVDIAFHSALQFFCYQQFAEVRRYADHHKILLKGDIPILISRNSADVWHATRFFDLSLAAGAPPDQYNKEGQYWGFPLFDWETMRQEDYLFWRERLHAASHYYHLYRIDHAVGFFRIWGIPPDHSSKEGSFIPPEEDKWLPQGTHLLSMIAASSSMLPIAEDLGVIPPEVRICLAEMGIPGTRVMRWEVDKSDRNLFLPLKDYPPLSMTCVSTHDSTTLAGWWRDEPEDAMRLAEQKKWEYTPELTRDQLYALLWDSHHTASLFHINLLQEYLSLFPELVANDPAEERINVPGTLIPTNWTYRYRPSLEVILAHKELLATVQSLVST